MDEEQKAEARRRSYAKTLAHRALEQICELRDFACSNARATWMPEELKQFWDLVEIKSESIRESMDSIIDVIKKGD